MEEFGFLESAFVWRYAMIVAVLSAATLAYLGVWVALKRVVFVPLALSQVSSFGLMLAALVGSLFEASAEHGNGHEMVLHPLLLSILAAVGLGAWLARRRDGGSQAVVSAYLVASVGVLLVGNLVQNELHDLQSVLFGSAVLVETHQIFIVGGAALVVGLVHFLFYRRFLFVSFDADAAGATGIPVYGTHVLLMTTFALMIAVVTHAIGALPAFGFMVLPGLFALRVGESMRGAFVYAIVVGIFSAALGYYLSFRFNTPTGATMVALSALAYLGALALPAKS